MSAEPLHERNYEYLARNYINSALGRFEEGLFALLEYKCRVYGGISQALANLGDVNLVKVIKIQAPLEDKLVEAIFKVEPHVRQFNVDESLSLEDRDLFYAHSLDGNLTNLNPEERRYLVDNNLF